MVNKINWSHKVWMSDVCVFMTTWKISSNIHVKWLMNTDGALCTQALNPQSLLLVSPKPPSLYERWPSCCLIPCHTLTVELAGGNVRWCMLTCWHFKLTSALWTFMFLVLKMRSIVCSMRRACNETIIIKTACWISSSASLMRSVKPVETVLIIALTCMITFWNKGYNLLIREPVGRTNDD